MAGAGLDRRGANGAKLAHVVSAVLAGALLADVATAQVEAPLDVLAVAVRAQGHPCDKPVRAERDATASKPNRAVWRLQCSNGSYRVVLRPDMAAEVEVLD